ncbi:hypothetical protein HP398_29635 [Brevibacillus sp. HB1.4B]|uniref:hypothetical protein n=1 Tax=Brevibacillus sp. HB1.4B TaxID=2738845 RepID=UPI00156AC955|nr:hypothetical protein [Brevibacillus sp. HB1.4B]NRS20584.1 hypothetical protein [Brevibacillus sp. HB1.4B]
MHFKLLVSIIMMIAFTMTSAGVVSAETSSLISKEQIQIPDSVKNLEDLVEFLQSKGVVNSSNDLLNYMKNNKQIILKLNPSIIDYAFTYRLYAETNTPIRDDGSIKITHKTEAKGLQVWVVPFTLTNVSSETPEVNKDNFALVPKNIIEGNELDILAIKPEYIMDAANGNILGNFEFPTNSEVHLNAVFYVHPTTSEQNVNMRIYDGKDHADISISKE